MGPINWERGQTGPNSNLASAVILENRATLFHIVVHMHIMAFHPTGITVEIVGIESSTQGRGCDEHVCCGSLLAEDTVVRFRQVQVIVKGKEESAIAAYLVSDGIDQCRVGFLPRHLVKHSNFYDGALAQIVEVYSEASASPSARRKFHHNKGCCVAAIISALPEEAVIAMNQGKRNAEDNNNSVDNNKD